VRGRIGLGEWLGDLEFLVRRNAERCIFLAALGTCISFLFVLATCMSVFLDSAYSLFKFILFAMDCVTCSDFLVARPSLNISYRGTGLISRNF